MHGKGFKGSFNVFVVKGFEFIDYLPIISLPFAIMHTGRLNSDQEIKWSNV
jgi:hypothetical protein